ncbi:MAG: hypothetical protein IIC81_03275 [Chloroflexi bacterium]|nr:hypothetical protein [Chloroflexota bacterium]
MSNISINAELHFPLAGITFKIEVGLPEGASQGASITISPVDSASGEPIPIRDDSSAVLADFAPAFNRWLRRCTITGTVEETRITGAFHQDVDLERLLRYTADICDMITQRFSLYQEKVFA